MSDFAKDANVSCEDTISRQAAIDALHMHLMYRMGTDSNKKRLDEWINNLPSAQPEQRWIPCSERVPDDLAEVNITYVNTRPEPYYNFLKGKPFAGTAVYYKGRWYWYSAVCVDYLGEYGFSPNDEMDDYIKVIAWKPLPEPYIGE